MRQLRPITLTAFVVTTIMMTGCAADGTGSNGAAEDTHANTLTYLETQTWTTLFPPAGGFYPNGGVINQITDRLLYQDSDTLELHPWIATELPQINENATEYTFTLREGVTYSDGTPVNAENVVKNFDLFGAGAPDRALPVSEAVNNYERGEALDEYTVKFYFSAPAPGFAQAVSTINSGLLSNATLDRDGAGFGPGNATEVIGSGPFVITDEQIGSGLSLATRDDYHWASPVRAHQGPAQIDGIDFIVASESSVRVGTVVSGQADIARTIPAPDEVQFAVDGLSLLAATTNGVNNGLNLRFGHPLLEDIRVRQAIFAAIDREQIVETLFTESYPLATGVLARSVLGYVDTSESYEYHPERAETLLEETGWKIGSDGIRQKNGDQLVLTFNEALPQPRSKDVITLIQEQLKNVGVGVEIFAGDQVAQDEAAKQHDTIQIFHSMLGRADYDVLKSQYYSANRNALLNLDPATKEVRDQPLNDLLQQIASVPSGAGRQEASAAAQHHLTDEAYVLPLFEEPQVFGIRDAVHGFDTESIGRPSFYEVSLR